MRNYFIIAGCLGGLCSMGFAQSVTVATTGGDFNSLTAAIAGVKANAAGPDVITFLDAGPFAESAQIIIDDNSSNDLTIKGNTGIRPIVMSNFSGNAIDIHRPGNTTIKDLILIPAQGTAATRPTGAVVVNPASPEADFFIQFQNILTSSNNGADAPTSALNGLSAPAVSVPANFASFRGEGYRVNSADTVHVHRVVCTDCIISGLNSAGVYGFRGFLDGAAGSEYTISAGCVVSYCTATAAASAAFQPGGDEGATLIGTVKGTAAKPVKFINNDMLAVNTTANAGPSPVGFTKSFEYMIIANGTKAAFQHGHAAEKLTLTSCTIVNNAAEALTLATTFNQTVTATNCIFAGNGIDGTSNVIKTTTTGGGTMSVTDSAIVLSGAYKLDTANFDNDGLNDSTPSNVTKTNVTSANPAFASVDPTNAGFVTVTSPAYEHAGPGGGPLSGAGAYNKVITSSAAADWDLFM